MGKNCFKVFSFIIFFIVITAFSARAENGAKLSFKEAVTIAFDRHPKMIEAYQAIEASRGGLWTARTLDNPEIEIEEDMFEVKQPFGPVGSKILESQIASNDVKTHEQTFKAVRAEVYLEIRDIYSNIILNKKRLELADQNLDATRQFFSRVQNRYESGQVLKNDFQRAKIETLRAENNYLSAQKEYKVEKAKLNLALGRAMDTDFEIVEELKEENLTASYEELKQMTIANRPDVRIAELELDSKKKALVKEQLSRLPSWSVGFQRTEEEGKDDSSILIGFEIPLWNLNQGEVKKANAEKEAQKAKVDAAKNEAVFNIYDAYLTAELHQRQLNLAKKSLEESSELFRLANIRYSEGEIDFLNYLDQVKTAEQTKVDYYEALFNLSRSISVLEISIYASLRGEEDFLK